MKIEILHPFGLSGSEIFSSIHPRKARLIAGMLSLVLESGRIPRRASSLGTSPADGEPMTFAGLWDEWKDKATGEVLKSCTMLITEPNGFVAEVHDRMPVVLESKDFVSWLNEGGLALAVTLPYVARELGKSVSFAEISKYVEQNAERQGSQKSGEASPPTRLSDQPDSPTFAPINRRGDCLVVVGHVDVVVLVAWALLNGGKWRSHKTYFLSSCTV
jgi:hypothetical protein